MKQKDEQSRIHENEIKLYENGGLTLEAIELLLDHPADTPKGQALREQLLRQELYS